MLIERRIPLQQLSSLKGPHCRVMAGLLLYADKDGVCWPSLRTLSAAVPMAVRGVRRALGEMAALGYLVIEKGVGRAVNRYRIAARFLRAAGCPVQPVSEVPSVAAVTPAHDAHTTQDQAPDDDPQLAFDFNRPPSVVCAKLPLCVRTVRTESKVIEIKESLKKSEAIPSGRDAPPKEPTTSTSPSTDHAKEITERKAENWRNKVVRFVQHRYSGQELRIRLLGLMGEDPVVDAKLWYKVCEEERVAADWDDVRDRRKTRRQDGFGGIWGAAVA